MKIYFEEIKTKLNKEIKLEDIEIVIIHKNIKDISFTLLKNTTFI